MGELLVITQQVPGGSGAWRAGSHRAMGRTQDLLPSPGISLRTCHLPSLSFRFSSVNGGNCMRWSPKIHSHRLSTWTANTDRRTGWDSWEHGIHHHSSANSPLCEDVPELCCGQHTLRNFLLLLGYKYRHPHTIHIKNPAGNGTSNDP